MAFEPSSKQPRAPFQGQTRAAGLAGGGTGKCKGKAAESEKMGYHSTSRGPAHHPGLQPFPAQGPDHIPAETRIGKQLWDLFGTG